ncbi:hypothetical protein FRB90_000109, partial [Tulasnella sp. 427]
MTSGWGHKEPVGKSDYPHDLKQNRGKNSSEGQKHQEIFDEINHSIDASRWITPGLDVKERQTKSSSAMTPSDNHLQPPNEERSRFP